MIRKKVFLLLLTVVSVSHSQNQNDNDDQDQYTNTTTNNIENVFLNGNQNFAKEFYNEIIQDKKYAGKSFIYSPFSIQIAGALLYAGADGDTAHEILNGLKFGSNDSTKIGEYFHNTIVKSNNPIELFKIANKIYVQDGQQIASDYKTIIENSFQSEIENINFNENEMAAKQINDWVELKTNNKIKDFIQADILNSDIRLFLLNAIHFKGFWKELFNKNSTIKRDFYKDPDNIIQLDTMSLTSEYNLTFSNSLGLKAINIPFKDSDLSLFLVSPSYHNQSLKTIENKLMSIDLKKDLFDTTYKISVSARIPKFKIETEIDMEEPLKNLGMQKMYSIDANLNNILDNNEPLSVTKSIHKAVIEVNEEGAEAAAASAHAIRRKSGPLRFSMNQSFIYFIKNNDGQVYFMGRFTGE